MWKDIKRLEKIYLILINLFILFKVMIFQLDHKVDSLVINSFINTIGIFLIMLPIVFLCFNKKYKGLFFGLNFLVALLLFANTIYYSYFGNMISIQRIKELAFLNSVGESIINLIKPNYFLYFIDLIPLGILYIYLNNKGITKKFIISFKSMIIVIISGLALIGASMYFNDSKSENSIKITNNMGIIYYHYYDVKNYIKESVFGVKGDDDKNTRKQMQKFFEDRNADRNNKNNKYRGIEKDKNLIIVQAEALQGFVINRTIEGKEITPNLNNFAKESLYFDNLYEQTYMGTTSDAELLSNVSIYPDLYESVYKKYSDNEYTSMAKVFNDLGYNTYVLHGNEPTFWNRKKMYKKIGFNRFFSKEDYPNPETLGMGVSDKYFFQNSLDKLNTNEQFYSFFITLSSHDPFTAFENYKFEDGFSVGKYEGTVLGNYIKAQHYADMNLGMFINKLKGESLYDKSLLVIYGDHKAIQYEYKDLLGDFLDIKFNNNNWNSVRKVPLFIHGSNIHPKKVSTVGGQIDIMPTVFNLLGLESPYYSMGKDLLNVKRGYAVHTVGFVVTDDYYYNWMDEKFYNPKSGKVIDGTKYQDEVKKYLNEIDYSEIILKENLMKDK